MKEERPDPHVPDKNYNSDHLFCNQDNIHEQVNALLTNPEHQKLQKYLRFTLVANKVKEERSEKVQVGIKLAMQAIGNQSYDFITQHLNELSLKCVDLNEAVFKNHLPSLTTFLTFSREKALEGLDDLTKMRQAFEGAFESIQSPSLPLKEFMSWFEGLHYHLSVLQLRQHVSAMLDHEINKKKRVNHPDPVKQGKQLISGAMCDAVNFISNIETENSMPVVMHLMWILMKEIPESALPVKDTLEFGIRMLHEGDESQCLLQLSTFKGEMKEYLRENYALILKNFEVMASKLSALEFDTKFAPQLAELNVWLTGLCVRTETLGYLARKFIRDSSKHLSNEILAQGYRTLVDLADKKIKSAKPRSIKGKEEAAVSSPSVVAELEPSSDLLPVSMYTPERFFTLFGSRSDSDAMKVSSLENALKIYPLSKRQVAHLADLREAIVLRLKVYQERGALRWLWNSAHHAEAEQAIDDVLQGDDEASPEEMARLIRILIALSSTLKIKQSDTLLGFVTSLIVHVHDLSQAILFTELKPASSDEAQLLNLLGEKGQSVDEKIASLNIAVTLYDLSPNLLIHLGSLQNDAVTALNTYCKNTNLMRVYTQREHVPLAEAAIKEIEAFQVGEEKQILKVLFKLQEVLVLKTSDLLLTAVNNLLVMSYDHFFKYREQCEHAIAPHARFFPPPAEAHATASPAEPALR